MRRSVAAAVLCACVGLPADASAQDTPPPISYVRLTHDTTVDGIRCGPSGRWRAGFFPSGRLESCALAEDYAVQRHALPARTWIHLRESGELASVWLPRDAMVQGHLCRGTGNRGWSVTFYPDGGLRTCYLAEEAVVQGVPCRKGSFWGEIRGGVYIRFHRNGRLATCSAARSFVLHGTGYRHRERVWLDVEGLPRTPG
jgi:hypothetical protein